MNIAIIGNGDVGGALRRGLQKDDHQDEAAGGEPDRVPELGFDAVDAGPLENARRIEPLAALSIQLGYAIGSGTEIGFRLAA